MVIKKKQVVIAALTVALGAAVFVNWYYTRPETQLVNSSSVGESSGEGSDEEVLNNLGDAQYVSSTVTGNSVPVQANAQSEYFAKAKLSRQSAHDEMSETLNDVINSPDASEQSKSDAATSLSELAKSIKLESDTESLITAKLGSECLVAINGDKVNVIISQGVLNDTTALQIKDIVVKQTGFKSDSITLTEAK